MSAWYNEPDPGKAAWLRELIKAGVIAPGDVDERSIREVKASELMGYTQCHFFAGIGVWSYALRQAGCPDDRPVWTGSCPCPSFSEAGKGEGFDDGRHLWPVWDSIIGERRPPVVFGEQSHAAIGFGWLDLISGNLEAKGYAVAAAVLGAHSVGAPHRRQRLYFCADTEHDEGRTEFEGREKEVGIADGRHCAACDGSHPTNGGQPMRGSTPGNAGYTALSSGLGVNLDAKREGLEGHFGDVRDWRGPGWLDPQQARSIAEAGATRGYWADCDWWYGRDERYRPIGPGLFPLATRAAARVLRLRGFGDSIVAPLAIEFIKAYYQVTV